MNTPVKEKLQQLLDYLNHGLVERDSTLKAALLTMLAGENLLLVGPPGTAKSLIARKVAECLTHDGGTEHAGGYFEYLLTKFSTPEEIFGPLSISELKADRFKRNTTGYLPSVRMAFLDEIFKASSSILNALLTILNERLYHNGAEAQKVPLQALIAASNELPTGQEELDALYDRFLVRSFVDYVSEDNLPRLLDKPGPAPTITPLSSADLTAIRQAAEAVTLPAEIVSAIQKIWAGHKQMFKEDRRENLSDRRLRKVVWLLCVSAATNGRQQIDFSDLLLLKDCLWNHPDNAQKVRELVLENIRSQQPSAEKLTSNPASLVEVRLPDWGEIDSGTIVNWQKKEGDVVSRDEILAEIETGKTCDEIPSPTKGTLVKIIKSSGDTVISGGVIAYIDPKVIGVANVIEYPESSTHSATKLGAVVKGYQGSGTESDPILIKNVHDLVGLERPEVGQNGYYFRQTADIDCSEITTWLKIDFQGHYDGKGHTIDYKSKEPVHLFQYVKESSQLSHLHLKGLGLAIMVKGSVIIACTSDGQLLRTASNCTISSCQSGGDLVLDAVKCTIGYCQSASFLVAGSAIESSIYRCYAKTNLIMNTASACTIQDCQVQSTLDGCHIAGILKKNSIVERCFVAGGAQ